jgi:hypothetical protein
MPDGRLFAFYYVHGEDTAGKAVSENRVMELRPDGTSGPEVQVPLKHPLQDYFMATVRAGSSPSPVIDLLGHRAGVSNTVSHARVRLW